MKLELKRRWLTPNSTIGELLVDGVWDCFVLEDRYRPPPEPKVPGSTCIPCGTYQVRRTLSARFGMVMPLVLDVPGFAGIRIHPGNTKEDTGGCLLPGLGRGADQVVRSRVAFHSLDSKLAAAEERGELITLTITIA